ncbi:MAG: helix-turn-helix domain-containing protein [Bacteroidota bacterium]
MQYLEYQPPAYFSQHLECFWEMTLTPEEVNNPFEVMSPDCTFEILFADRPVFIRSTSEKTWKQVLPGATFIGQKTSSFNFAVRGQAHVFGIRFKPFAFANLIKTPLFHLNDQVQPLQDLFELNRSDQKIIQEILSPKEMDKKIELAEGLVLRLLKKSFSIDQTFRAQLNYILDRKGMVKINDLLTEFNTSKVTLRKHFIHKMGLPPKRVSRIWRMNYLLELQKIKPAYNLTELCLEAGFFDQAHFTKEFKSFFSACPLRFFKQESQLVKISQETIVRRFSHQYDPR